MATHQLPILGFATMPDTSGNVWFEPAALTQTNDRYSQLIARFKDTATKISLGGRFTVPQNYVGTATVIALWTSTATTGNVVWNFDYTSIAASGETFDPGSDQEAVAFTATAAPASSQLGVSSSKTLTSGNLAAGDNVQFNFSRDGASGSDTMAADAVLYALIFQYADV